MTSLNGVNGVDVNAVDASGSTHPDYLPTQGYEDIPITPPFDFVEPATRADPALPVFHQPGVVMEELTPFAGIKVTGLQLSQLDAAGLDQLGLLTALKGCVFFGSTPEMKQDFIDIGMEKQLNIGRHFGHLHKNPTLPHPASTVEISVVYRDGLNGYSKLASNGKLSRVGWHFDQPFEPQPPGVTIFACIESPKVGGDTLFANVQEAYNRLSPPVQEFLSNLQVKQTSEGHASRNRAAGDVVRGHYTESHHPLVVLHPATGKPGLYFGQAANIVGLSIDESRMVMEFLQNFVVRAADLQARYKWTTGDVCLWDQRVLMHAATVNVQGDARRHFFRITPLAGVPIPAGEKLRKVYQSSRTDGL